MAMLNGPFEAATLAYLDELQAYLTYTQVIDHVALGLPPPTFLDNANAVAASNAYVAAFTASLADINEFQARGIAHYNPVYLNQAADFLLTVSVVGVEDALGPANLIASVNYYGSMYNDGNWSTYDPQLRRRDWDFMYRDRWAAALLDLKAEGKVIGPTPIADSDVWAAISTGTGLVLSQPSPADGTIGALTIRLFAGKNTSPLAVQVVVYASQDAGGYILQGISDVNVDFSKEQEQVVPLVTPLPLQQGQYVGIRNNSLNELFLNWTDGGNYKVWWPSLPDQVGSTVYLGDPTINIDFCGWAVLL